MTSTYKEEWLKETLRKLNTTKAHQLSEALKRRSVFTTCYIIEHWYVETYEEGTYLIGEDTRVTFKVFFNNEGKVARKPKNIKMLGRERIRIWSEGFFKEFILND